MTRTTQPDGNGGGIGLTALVQLANAASRKVPAVKYAFGLAGIAACGAIIALVLGTTKSALVILALTFVGSVLLFIFAKLSTSSNQSVFLAGSVLVWAVVGFFTFFLMITTTAFVGAWPQPWADFLGVSPNNKETELCTQRVNVMWTQFFNPNNQYSDALKTAAQVASCAPFQFYTLKGSIAFYTGDYFGAVEAFEAAHRIDPMDDPITRNLGDSYVEVGRLNDALAAYSAIKNKNALWNYKMARVKYHQGLLDDALALVKKVPSDLSEDGGLLGRPRILEAAILLERIKIASESKADALIDAREKFKNGIEFDRQQWEHIFKINHRTKYETFDKQFETLKPYLSEWL
jgi:hypothetical protein